MAIHPTAIVDPSAVMGDGVVVGPYCIVEGAVRLGAWTVLESHVVIKVGTVLGEANHVFEGAVIGGTPQHVSLPPRTGGLVVGDRNTIREHVTIHRSMLPDRDTVVGNDNLLMVGAHVAHDCLIGQRVVLTNGVKLAGHVEVEDRAFISGGVAVHQFCRIGRLAMVGGQARITKDVPPYMMIDGHSGFVVGLNTIGLRRNGFTSEQILDIKNAYRLVYRSGMTWNEIVSRMAADTASAAAATYSEFFARSKRGITPERRPPPGATLRLAESDDAADEAAAARAKSRAG